MRGSDSIPTPGDFVEVRTRRWLVESVTGGDALARARLACIDDDAQGETLEVLWRDEVDASVVADSHLSVFENPGTDDPEVFSAYLRSIRWNTATAADRKLLQAPFRAGIHLDAYQLVPLAKALALPRINLLIADDVGAGKTIEAGLILRELILRRRVDFVVVCAPPSMTRQWQDELQAKFGLAFTIIDREYLAAVRRERGFAVNPWSSGSLFLLSHSLVTDEVYTAGLRDVLGEFRARSLLILDEAHHAAPASGSRYAIDSQFTRAIEALAPRFEHRLFLTATPHNGHSNSFTKLLEILDPQRFTAGVDVRPDDLAPVMVRRLKSDLKRFGENFPTRRVEAIVIDGLPPDAPELVLANKLAAYDALVADRTRNLPPAAVARSRLTMVGLQQRLLSSIPAFTRTLEKHRDRLEQQLSEVPTIQPDASLLEPAALEDEPEDEAEAEARITKEEDEAAEAIDAGIGDKALVDEMLEIARRHANRPDARIAKLNAWIRENMTAGGQWTDRRLLLFTEYEDTRRWLERRLLEALHDLDPEDRIACFTGATSTDRREELKRRFNADPATDPLAAEHGYGHEMYNFRNVDARYYGYVPPTGTLRFENHFSVPKDTEVLEGVTVVWTAPHPEQGGRAVVGVWRDATVYRHDQEPTGALARRRKIGKDVASYRCTAEAKNCVRLPPDARPIFVPARQRRSGESWPGQQKVFYPKPKSQALRRLTEILRDIDRRRSSGAKASSGKGRKAGRSGWQVDVEKRRQIEVAAVKAVGLHLEDLGFTVRSVEKDNLGYDLVATRGDETLHVEVKGRSGSDVIAELSVNEFDCLTRYQRLRKPAEHYRIAIVTDALAKPVIHEFVLVRGPTSAETGWWTLDGQWRLQFEERKAAKLTAQRAQE